MLAGHQQVREARFEPIAQAHHALIDRMVGVIGPRAAGVVEEGVHAELLHDARAFLEQPIAPARGAGIEPGLPAGVMGPSHIPVGFVALEDQTTR